MKIIMRFETFFVFFLLAHRLLPAQQPIETEWQKQCEDGFKIITNWYTAPESSIEHIAKVYLAKAYGALNHNSIPDILIPTKIMDSLYKVSGQNAKFRRSR